MAALNFTAAPPADAHAVDGTQISFTYGKSHLETVWSDRRTIDWASMAGFFMSAPTGNKSGSCYVPAVFRGSARNLNDADQIDVAVLDSDCGHTFEEIVAAVRSKGWAAIVHSTYSHMDSETDISKKMYDLWAQGRDEPTVEQYFREKKGYLEHVIAGAQIVEERGTNYVVRHNPCPRFRVLLPLSAPWRAVGYQNQVIANSMWRSRIQALAHSLGLFHDQSCTDTSRLFYFPRVRVQGAQFISDKIDGSLCDIWSLPDAPAEAPPAQSAASMFAPRARAVQEQRKLPLMTGDVDLRSWMASDGYRFEIGRALRARNQIKFGRRQTGVKQHVLCPFDDEHTIAGDLTGTFVVNSSELAKAGLQQITSGFACMCKHSSCAHRDRLDHLAKMIELGWLLREDLQNPDFYVGESLDLSGVDASAFLNKIRNSHAAKAGISGPYGAIPEHLFHSLPGVLGQMYEYVLGNTVKPQPVMALSSAISLISTVVGRKVEVAGWGTPPNLFLCNVAISATGKGAPLNAIKEVFNRAGQLGLIGVEEFVSAAGVLSELQEKPNQIILVDEIGFALTAMSNKNDAHKAAIVPLLLKLYDAQKAAVFRSGSYADAKKNFSIVKPCVGLLGATTPRTLYDSLSTKDIQSGLLNRFMIFDCGDYDVMRVKPKRTPIPQELLDWIAAWVQVPLHRNLSGEGESQGNLPSPVEGGAVQVTPLGIAMTNEAERVFEEFAAEMMAAKRRAAESGLDELYGRADENAMKLALTWAVCAGPEAAVIDGPGARWATDLCRATTNHMAKMADTRIADNGFQRQVANIRALLEKAGPRGLTKAQLGQKKSGKIPPREMTEVLNHLRESGEVQFLDTNAGKTRSDGFKVKPREAYVFNSAAGADAADEEGEGNE